MATDIDERHVYSRVMRWDNNEDLVEMNPALFIEAALGLSEPPSLLRIHALLDTFAVLPWAYASTIAEKYSGGMPKLHVDVAETLGINYLDADYRIETGMEVLRDAVASGRYQGVRLPFRNDEYLTAMNPALFIAAIFGTPVPPSLLLLHALLDRFAVLSDEYRIAIAEKYCGEEPKLHFDVAEALGINYADADHRIETGMTILRTAVADGRYIPAGTYECEYLPFPQPLGSLRHYEEPPLPFRVEEDMPL